MEKEMMPCACTIAGSDPGGGAGIQADLKIFHALGVYGLSVITALTVQNTREVRDTYMVPPELLSAQISALTDDFTIGAFKTGMLGTAELIEAVAEQLPEGTPLVLDPVMVSTGGHSLLDEGALSDLTGRLFPRATVVTPNIPEAAALTRRSGITTMDECREAGLEILDLGPEFVLIKGGHASGPEAADLLMGHGKEWVIATPRYPCRVHGSGCCFSAAICAFLVHGSDVPEAFRQGKQFIDQAIKGAVRTSSGIYVINPGPWQGSGTH